jgi:hypothetical protein
MRAVHLASALAVEREELVLVTSDADLGDAAQATGALLTMTALESRSPVVASWSHSTRAPSADAAEEPSTEPKVRGSNPLGRAPSFVMEDAAMSGNLARFRGSSALDVVEWS